MVALAAPILFLPFFLRVALAVGFFLGRFRRRGAGG
jgi:hypothetical protein